MKLSIIIPAYNEASVILQTLKQLREKHHPDEVIVVDGGSEDDTCTLAQSWAQVIYSEKGRASQMNAGAKQATGDIFLFLHADTVLPMNGLKDIQQVIESGKQAGRFRLQFDDTSWQMKLYASYTRFPFFSYGDQGFFVTRAVFEQLNGFDVKVPFEDIDFYKRLSQITKPVILKSAVTTSARRFQSVGRAKQKWVNFWLVLLYYLGVDIFWLKKKFYPDIR